MVGEAAPAAGLATVSPARSPKNARRDGSRATEVLIVPGDVTCERRARMQDAPPAGGRIRDRARRDQRLLIVGGARLARKGGRPTGRPPFRSLRRRERASLAGC